METYANGACFSIIIVPAINASPIKLLGASSWKWLRDLTAEEGIEAQVLVFEYKIADNVDLVWEELERAGSDLLEDLLDGPADYGVRSLLRLISLRACSLALVARAPTGLHLPWLRRDSCKAGKSCLLSCVILDLVCLQSSSLAVLLLHCQKALSSTHGHNSNPRLGSLLQLNSGIVFLGTPHPTYDHHDRWARLLSVLRAEARLSRRTLTKAEPELQIMAGISQTFRESGVDVPVLCVYETLPTRPMGGFLSASQLVRTIHPVAIPVQALR